MMEFKFRLSVLLKGRGSKVEKIAFNNCLHMPLLAELLNSFDSLYMTDPFLYFFVVVFIYIYLFIFFACHANPFYPEQQLITFLKIRASIHV